MLPRPRYERRDGVCLDGRAGGALIAIDRRDRKVGAMSRVLQREGVPVRTSAGSIAQVWRAGPRQANLARALPGLEVAVLDELAAKKVGALVGSSGTAAECKRHTRVATATLLAPSGLGRDREW